MYSDEISQLIAEEMKTMPESVSLNPLPVPFQVKKNEQSFT
jgi:hypothetical protein